MLQFNIRSVPFSRYGSYIAFSRRQPRPDLPDAVCLRNIHGDASKPEVFVLDLFRERQSLPYQERATPGLLTLAADAGTVEICLAEKKLIRVRCRGVALRLISVAGEHAIALPREGGTWQVNSPENQLQYQFIPLSGKLVVMQGEGRRSQSKIVVEILPDPATGTAECAIGEFRGVWQHDGGFPEFDACVRAVDAEFQQWLQTMPETPAHLAEAAALAAYINWSAVVDPEGMLKRPGMLMSKNWMTNVWSWDHCFNAMALSYHNPREAWNQLMVMFDVQNRFGALPDTVNDTNRQFTYTKPPVHGWALKWIMDRGGSVTTDHLREIYEPLCRWTEFWFRYRDDDHDGIPQYNHGNDSGWDNSTLFLGGVPIEGPDLCAFLTVQMEVLAEVAGKLGKAKDAQQWSARAADLPQAMLRHCWRGDRFVAPRSGRHNAFESDSLVAFVPIFLGKRLPPDIRAKLIAGLKEPGAFLTEYGLATERVSSPFYLADGYWRGPIWAPSTMILVRGLADAGEPEFAKEIARRFCDLCVQSGFAENYNALTGAPLRDPGYTWTASVFLLLAHEYLMKVTD